MRRVFVSFLVGGVILLASVSCSAGRSTPSPTSSSPTSSSPTVVVSPVDPVADLRASEDADLLDGVEPSLHRSGRGPAAFRVVRPAGDARELRFFVSCAPESRFTVTAGTFYSGPCGAHYRNSGSIPLPSGDGPVPVTLDLPAATRFWIVAIPDGG